MTVRRFRDLGNSNYWLNKKVTMFKTSVTKTLSTLLPSFRWAGLLLVALCWSIVSPPADGHFPWLTSDSDGHVSLHFGESLDDRTYAMPEQVANAEVRIGQKQKIPMNKVESDDFVGRRSAQPVTTPAQIGATIHYGNYHGTDLTYCVQHLTGSLSDGDRFSENRSDETKPGDEGASSLALECRVVDTPKGVTCTIYFEGEPLVGADVKLFCAEGHQEAAQETNKDGQVKFNDQQIEPGLNGIVVGHVVDAQGDDSLSQTHYLTATFFDPEDAGLSTTNRSTVTPSTSLPSPVGSVEINDVMYPEIPQLVTSFGAAICDGNVFLYGGHTGQAHHYDNESQANTLWQIPVDGNGQWQAIATGPRLQGLAMVADDRKLYRIGGFTARNESGDEHDLWSQSDVESFDLATNQWTELPSLPEPRSSFDAAVLDGTIYVVGGWTMAGESDSIWLDTAYRMDLSESQPTWKPLARPPFKRRALSLAAYEGKIYAIGGMRPKGGPSKQVDVYDPETDSWMKGPDLLGETMDGFGSSSFATGGRLYTTTYSGLLQRLTKDGSRWELVAELPSDRFFHRLLQVNDTQLLTVGGASMSRGKFGAVEVISLQ